MSSTILNVLFGKLLANFLEIDTSKTNVSILSVKIKLENLKIKREVFEYYYIPYFELLHGYVGSLNIDLKMPFFYNNPIKVEVNKIYAHFRQKDINKLNKDEELHTILEYKKNILLNEEQFAAEIDEMKKQNKENMNKSEDNSPGIVQKIINNLIIDIKDVVIRFDDNLSYKGIPFSIGIILNHVLSRSTKSDFKLSKDINEVIPLENKNYKILKLEQLSMFMDLYHFEEELNFEKLISPKVKTNMNLKNFLKDEYSFYSYCESELKFHSNEFDSHQYLLFQLYSTTYLTLNNNVKDKKQPKLSMKIEFPQILLNATFKQMKVFLKFLAYINLNSLYQKGISTQYFNGKLSLNEKKTYVEGYAAYFRDKYIKKLNVEFPESLKSMEKKLNYREILLMRFCSKNRLEYTKKLEEIDEKINNEKEKLIRLDDNKIQNLLKQKSDILKKEQQFLQNMFQDDSLIKMGEMLLNNDLGENYINTHIELSILMTSLRVLRVYEFETRKENGKWGFKYKIMTISIHTLKMELNLQNVGQIFLFTLKNIVIIDKRIKNPNYNKIIFGDLTSKEEILCIFMEINPLLKKSNLRIKIWSENNLYILLNDYTLQYISTQSANVFTTTILLEEYSLYAKDSVLKYIKEGYENQYSPTNFSHTNVLLDINFKCPIIIMPIDIFDETRTECLLISLGELTLKSILPPRVESNPQIDYKTTKDESIMYDIYRIDLRKTKIATVDNCIEKYNYNGKETLIMEEVNFTMDCKLLIQYENPNFDNIVVDIIINDMKFKINEFQILLMIEWLKNYMKNGYKVQLDFKSIEEEQKEEKLKLKSLKNIKEKVEPEEINKSIEVKNEKKMDLIPYEEKKKKADLFYKSFIKSFSSSNYHRVSTEIKTIYKNKKSVLVSVVLKSVNFTLQRNYPDNTIENYLVFEMKLFHVECDIALDSSLIVIVTVKKISLIDYDRDEKKNFIINRDFQYLIESTTDIETNRPINIRIPLDDLKRLSFIDYQLLMKGDELNNIVHINDLNIIISLESMLRMYQFSMYYTEIYLNEMNNAEIWRKGEIEKRAALKENALNQNKIEDENDKRFNKYTKNYMPYLIKEAGINNIKENLKKKKNIYKNIDDFREYLRNKYNKILGFERNKTKMTVLVRINNTNVKLPLAPAKTEEPLFNMNFNLVYNQTTTYLYTNFFTFPAKRIIATFYEESQSSMNTHISNFDLDMVYKIKSLGKNYQMTYTRNSPEERILTNFRMMCLIDSFIVLNSEQNVMVIDVILEPILFAFGMRQVRKCWILYDKVMKFLPLLWEKYVPYAKPNEINSGIKKKMTLKSMVKKVFKLYKIKNFNEKEMKKKKDDDKKVIVNRDKFNSLLITNVKSDKIGVIFFDNTNLGEKNILLNIGVKKLVCNYLQNSKITDKDNIIYTMYEILTGDQLPFNKFHRNNLSMYYYVFCSVQANYHNILTNKFEPLLENFEVSVEMMQVAPFFRAKTNVIINDIINYNLSVDSIIALNSFLLKFNQEEKMWDIKELIDPIKWRSTFAITEDVLKSATTRVYNLSLIFKNDSGIEIVYIKLEE